MGPARLPLLENAWFLILCSHSSLSLYPIDPRTRVRGAEWELLAVNDLGEDCYATPAIADGRIYIRTRSALYCFGKSPASTPTAAPN